MFSVMRMVVVMAPTFRFARGALRLARPGVRGITPVMMMMVAMVAMAVAV